MDWRRWLDVGAADGRLGSVALEVTDTAQLVLEVTEPEESGHAELRLDYSDAGQLLDWLREAMGVQLLLHGDPVAGAAVAGLEAAQRGAPPESDDSDSIQPRG